MGPLNRDHEAESLLLALSRFEREAAARLGVALPLGPRMAAALGQVQTVEQYRSIVHMRTKRETVETEAAHT